MELFDKAMDLAVTAHQGSTRKSSNTPYILHPAEVAAIASRMTDNLDVLCAALLHDVVEDANISLDYIEKEFNSYVAMLVSCETENKRKDLPSSQTWKIRKLESINDLAKITDKGAKIIWLADKLSNMRSIASVYAEIGDAVWNNFHQKDKDEQRWYYESVLENLTELSQYPAYQELKSLVYYVFDSKEENND